MVPVTEIRLWRRTSVVAVNVLPTGSTSRRADADLFDDLRRFSRGDAFDEQPMPGLDSEALDFRVASESFAPVRALSRRDLETLRLSTRHQGRPVPTVGGLLHNRPVGSRNDGGAAA
jgi:ATP-dependent DNA helicase RecG